MKLYKKTVTNSFKKGSKRNSSQSIANLRKVVKQVVNKQAEKKSFLSVYNQTLAPVDSTWYIKNLTYPLNQGITGETYIGRKIHIASMTFRCNLYTNTGSDTTHQARLIIFKHKDSLCTSAPLISTNGSQFLRSGYPTNPTIGHVDYSKILQKLYEVKFDLTKTIGASQVLQKSFSFNVPVNKTLTFTGDNTGAFDTGQYFMAWTGYNGSLTGTPVVLDYQYNINFTDI